jgi:hypothetical protein
MTPVENHLGLLNTLQWKHHRDRAEVNATLVKRGGGVSNVC